MSLNGVNIRGDILRKCQMRDELVWILRKNHNKWKTSGPYYGHELIQFLQSGLCSNQDFMWKPGFKEWKRISLVKGVSTHPGHIMEDILIQQSKKYQIQKPRHVRYLPAYSKLKRY